MIEFFQKIPKWLRFLFLFPLLFLNGVLLAFLIGYLQPLVNFLIISTLLAFLLSLLIEGLEQKGIRKKVAIPAILLLSLFLILLVGVILIPAILEQLRQLIESAPQWIQEAGMQIKKLTDSPLAQRLPSTVKIDSIISEATTRLSSSLQSLGSQGITLLLATFSNIFNGLIILILTLFFLASGQTFWDGIFKWVANPWKQRIPQYCRKTFKDYFLARVVLAVVSSIARWGVFMIIQVPYGIVFAFGIGLISLIPFVGGIVVLICTILLCFNNLTTGILFFFSALIIDQLTDNVLAPKLMGQKIGLHPIWILISVFLGAKVGGLLGVLLAVPIASVIKQIAEDLYGENQPMQPLLESEIDLSIDKI